MIVLKTVSDAVILTKRVSPAGVEPYGLAKYFFVDVLEPDSLQDVFQVLQVLENDPRSAVVRGELLPDVSTDEPIRRLLRPKDGEPATLQDCARPWVMIDVDHNVVHDQQADPEGAARLVVESLPEHFQGADCIWQCSSSAGLNKEVKVHLWFWLPRPMTSAEVRQWVSKLGLIDQVDMSVFSPIQLHYTAAPIFEGVEDPMSSRLGFLEGDRRSVSLDLINIGKLRHPAAGLVEAGKPFAEPGTRDSVMLSMVGEIAGRWPYCDVETVVGLFRRSIEAMRGEQGAPTEEKLRDQLTRMLEIERAKRPEEGALAPTKQMAVAQSLLEHHGEDLLYCGPLGGWFVWTGSRFEQDELDRVQGLVISEVEDLAAEARERHMREDSKESAAMVRSVASLQNAATVKGVLELAHCRSDVAVRIKDMDADPWLLGTPTGTVDLRTGDIRGSLREDRLTKQTGVGVSFRDGPRWLDFLGNTLQGDREIIGYIYRLLGNGLIGHVSEELLAVFYGGGFNGKSVLLDTVRTVMGDYAMQASPDIFMKSAGESLVSSERMNLKGQRLVVLAETSETKRLDDGRLKQLTSTDQIVGRYMKQNTARFDPTHQSILVTNNIPLIETTDEGTWRRISLIPFTYVVPKEKRIHRYADVLIKEEGPEILGWLIKGCLEYQRRGLDPPESVRVATNEYREDQDLLGKFLEERTVGKPGGTCGATELYDAYVRWTRDNSMTLTAFGRKMKARGFQKIKKGTVVYLGFELLDAQMFPRIHSARNP